MLFTEFDAARARLEKKDLFRRFKVKGEGEPLEQVLADGKMKEQDEILVMERGGRRLAFSVAQIDFHHVAEGELDGQPYMIAYCNICHSGTSMVPVVDGAVLHFGARGIYNGLALLGDDETGSYWNHITGECLHGQLKGEQMQLFPLERTTVRGGLKRWPNLHIALSKPHFLMRLLGPYVRFVGKAGLFPPGFGFRDTMGELDERLPEMTSGLGIFNNRVQRFYTVRDIAARGIIRDEFSGRPIQVQMDEEGAYPKAIYTDVPDDGTSANQPMQLYCRWYGFSLTFTGCELYGEKH
ncbi:hypothetical protein GCM10011571_05840 [Marinithermofilum abyssi]|uniref:DUF3179 domain-containing protein n=1 Tax=Marinithermofilum abyssi TaxID=1571185 RepID=A0A8J2VEF3_9BACL|nr:DUF3179 domain-containing (seleno)protein [Marinithermofilum abyssi]GGE07412.1 hypothetical protein GCM10011571_05840 [Marinithermofilum abyssi]